MKKHCPSKASVNNLFLEIAAGIPDVPAVVATDSQISYGELDRQSNILAGILSAGGAGPDIPIGVHIDRSINYIISLLAVLKSGSCYVPMDPDYPLERLKFIASDTACPIILSESANPAISDTARRIDLDLMDWEQTPQPVSSPAVQESLAYILYTSGSTGTPKGVEIEHHSLTNLVQWHHSEFPETPPYNVTQAASPGFDAAVWEIWSHLTQGATIHLIPDNLLLQPEVLAKWLQQKAIVECFLPTPLAEMMLDINWPKDSCLKYLHSGGERLTRKPPSDFPAKLTNLYGPTECTVISTWSVFAPGEDDGQAPTIGLPVTNCEVRIVDANLNEVPVDSEGEICISGTGLGRGYHNRQDLTDAAYVSNPFTPGEKLYLTGDLGVMRHDGSIDFIGRKDFQVKIRGFRIELGEIEAVMHRHEDVAKCVVIDRKSAGGGKFLAAYVTLKRENPAIINQLRTLTEEYLPDYMVPTTITILDKMPLTVNGKVDRRALPEPDLRVSGACGNGPPPQTQVEKRLAVIWEELLHVAGPCLDDNFFLLGGHSLLATGLCLEIEKRFNVMLPLHAVFEYPVLRDLAKAIEQASSLTPGKVHHGIQHHSRAGNKYPVSANQRGMWTMERISEVGNLFNIPLVITLRGPVNRNILEQSFNAILSRHESLRTGIETINDQPVQIIRKYALHEIEVHDLSGLSSKEQEKYYGEIIQQQRNIIFDLSQPPLFSTKLVKLNDNYWKFLFTVHHLVFDGWSSTVFFKELGENYQQLLSDGKVEQPPLKLDYVDFAIWQHEYLTSGIAERQLAYWRQKLGTVNPMPRLPFTTGTHHHNHKAGKRCSITIPPELTEKLHLLASRSHSTLFMVLTAVLQTQLFRYTGALDITTGTSIANRNHAGTDDMIGLFINALPLHNSFAGNPLFSAILKEVHGTTLNAYENQDLPFEELLGDLRGQHASDSIFKVSLLLQNLPFDKMEFSGIKMTYNEIGNETSKLDILITFEERDNELAGWLEYNSSLFSEDIIKQIAETYVALCSQVAENPAKPVAAYTCPLPEAAMPKTCYIAGETSMVPQCLNILQENGIHVLGVFTPDDAIREQVKKYNVPCYRQNNKIMREVMSVRPFDYLFSIINSMVLDEDILSLPQLHAINYHDAPLPRYAGMYSTSWALMNREPYHGISWHEMCREVDAGDIFIQRKVEIAPEDTAVSLNIKCTNTAIEAFRQLVQELNSDTVKPQPQDLSARTYYGLFSRPANACLLDWNRSAEELEAMVRALTFGNYDNNLGTAKIATREGFYIVSNAAVTDSDSNAPAGTVLATTDSSLTIAAGSGALKISDLKTLTGEDVTPDSIGAPTGKRLPEIANGTAAGLSAAYEAAAHNEAFWSRKLRALNPFEYPLPGNSGKASTMVPDEITLPDEILQATDPALAATALFCLFLARLSDSRDFDIGITIPPYEDESLAPLFAGKIPFRVNPDPEVSFKDNFAACVEALTKTLKRGTYATDIVTRFSGINTHFTCSIQPDGMRPVISLPDNADSKLIQEYFSIFIRNVAANPTLPLKKTALLSESDNKQQLFDWNNTKRDFDLDRTYAAHFAEQATKTPDAIAVKHNQAALTYKELNQHANQMANYLLEAGASGNAIIGICMERSLELAVALLGVFKAGCAYLPLDPKYPAERLDFMISDADVKIILTNSTGREIIKPLEDVTLINVRQNWPLILKQNAKAPQIEFSPEDTAYVIYTSGSTGTPKGVMLSQKNLLNHNFGVIQDYELTSKDNILQFGSISFDLSVEEIFPCWLCGATLEFILDGLMESPGNLFNFIERNNITFLDLPTAYWHELVSILDHLPLPESIRLVVIGGEQASVEHFKKWRQHTENVRLINSYGPTETTVIATWGEDLSTIGRPVANTQIYILNKHLQPQPAGLPGELYISGLGVAKGYLGQPELTAEKFIENPFIPGTIMYKTGDIARFSPDGEIIFEGRADNQIKLRGFRIELGGIESCLKQQIMINDALVCLTENKAGSKVLTAYVIVSGKIDIKKIKESLKAKLPEYMIPAQIMQLDAFPMTPNGKIDRKALPEPDFSGDESMEEYQPNSHLEMQIQLIFQKLFNTGTINPEDSFFDLGGDSLKAIKLLLEIERVTGCKLMMEKLYNNSSVRALCRYITSEYDSNETWSAIVPLNSPEASDKQPLYLLHTTPGDILGYINMVKLLDNRPVYGIQALGLNDISQAHRHINKMAEYYVSLIIEKQPEGPYFIGGWCFGGILALEVARRLIADGRKVKFLGLIETWGNPERDTAFYIRRLWQLFKWGPKGWLEYIYFKISKAKLMNHHMEQLDFISERFGNGNDVSAIENLKELYKINLDSFMHYITMPYDGKIYLFQSQEVLPGVIPDQTFGWEGIAKDLEIYHFEGNHGNILKEPYVRSLANKFTECMNKVE